MKSLLLAISPLLACIVNAQIVEIPTVVHVLWNDSTDNVSENQIQSMIDFVNMDYRRLNSDTGMTPEHFLNIAADTEIEFQLASIDPNGIPTSGIELRYTDSLQFNNMKFDSTGGANAWNTCYYFNIWITPKLNQQVEFGDPSFSSVPMGSEELDGFVTDQLTIETSMSFGLSHFTRHFGYYLGLKDISMAPYDICFDADSITDTPNSIWPDVFNPSNDCWFTINSCGNEYQDMTMNYMAHRDVYDCVNLFTQGQKERMHQTLQNKRPGLLDPSLCGLSVDYFEKLNLKIHPNPSSSLLRFSVPEKSQFEIIDLHGRIAKQGTANSGQNTINVEDLSKGVHLLKITGQKQVPTDRFIKQ